MTDEIRQAIALVAQHGGPTARRDCSKMIMAGSRLQIASVAMRLPAHIGTILTEDRYAVRLDPADRDLLRRVMVDLADGDADARTDRITIRVTPAERAAITQRAITAHRSVSDYLRLIGTGELDDGGAAVSDEPSDTAHD